MHVARPQLVCHHGTDGQPRSEHLTLVEADTIQGRTVDHWLQRVPRGASFTVFLWPAGWGQGECHQVLQHHSSAYETVIPPVAGGCPREVALLLPHGVTRLALLLEHQVEHRASYQLRRRPGDSEDLEAWAELVPPGEVRTVPSSQAAREILRRRRARGGE